MPDSPAPLTSLYTLDRDLSRDAVVAALAAIPDGLAASMRDVPPERLAAAAPDGGWSAFRVVCHMRDAAFVYAGRFRWMIFDNGPKLPNFDENNWVESAHDEVGDLPAILNEIAASRADLVRVLSRIPEAAWQRRGYHEVLGDVVLEPYVRHQLAHEEAHLSQVRGALGR